jgi:hypothetical protein
VHDTQELKVDPDDQLPVPSGRSVTRLPAVRLALGGAVAIALLYFFFRGVDWMALGQAFRSARPGYLAGIVGATLVVYLARAWRWGYLLAPIARVPLGRLFSVTVVGFMTGLLIPRAGEIVRPYLIARRYGAKTSAAFASIILERLFDLITVLALVGVYLFVLPLPDAQKPGPLAALKVAGGLAGLAAVLALLLLVGFHARAEATLGLVERLARRLPARLTGPVVRTLRTFARGLAVLRAPAGHLVAIAGQSLLVWLSVCLSFHFNHLAFGIDLPFHSTFLLVAFLTVGVAIPTPGMVGGFHQFYKLAMLEAFGSVGEGPAVAAGITAHALSNLPVLVLGLAFLGREGISLGRAAQIAGDETKETAGPPLSEPAAGGQVR